MWQPLLKHLVTGNVKALARSISLVENEIPGYEELLKQLGGNNLAKVIGITGPPGAGKSTLTDALIGSLVNDEKNVGVLCIDPSSPFNLGALLGDRIRMSEWYNNSNVFIRSLATRGSLGGLSNKIIELTDLMKEAGFDYVIIETVGVGQSEVEIAGIAEATVVVLMPASGDEVQVMKAGVMEIADIFVVNKSDIAGADTFVKNLLMNVKQSSQDNIRDIPVLKTIASDKKGIEELKQEILHKLASATLGKKHLLLAEKAYQLIRNKRMKDVNKKSLEEAIINSYSENFNLYRFIENYAKGS